MAAGLQQHAQREAGQRFRHDQLIFLRRAIDVVELDAGTGAGLPQRLVKQAEMGSRAIHHETRLAKWHGRPACVRPDHDIPTGVKRSVSGGPPRRIEANRFRPPRQTAGVLPCAPVSGGHSAWSGFPAPDRCLIDLIMIIIINKDVHLRFKVHLGMSQTATQEPGQCQAAMDLDCAQGVNVLRAKSCAFPAKPFPTRIFERFRSLFPLLGQGWAQDTGLRFRAGADARTKRQQVKVTSILMAARQTQRARRSNRSGRYVFGSLFSLGRKPLYGQIPIKGTRSITGMALAMGFVFPTVAQGTARAQNLSRRLNRKRGQLGKGLRTRMSLCTKAALARTGASGAHASRYFWTSV
uniref:Uncharacterized protein n=1 Tax=Ralstonia solanacearum TaxID=305 RepID=A0A0S4V4M5_RALSL|nr:conserved protein of unknown function [Ralstonia solanacearum]